MAIVITKECRIKIVRKRRGFNLNETLTRQSEVGEIVNKTGYEPEESRMRIPAAKNFEPELGILVHAKILARLSILAT